MININIPSALQPFTDSQKIVSLNETPRLTILDALETLCCKFPKLRLRLFKEDQILNRFINVYLNDEDIRFLDNLESHVGIDDEISLVPAIAGG